MVHIENTFGGGTVGNNVDILMPTIDLSVPSLIRIGDNVTITRATILIHDASLKKNLGYSKCGKVHIGSDVFIGHGAIILPNTTIGDKVVIGAGSVVAKDIPSNSVVVGNPAKVIGSYDEYVNKQKDMMEKYPVVDSMPAEMTDNDIKQISDSGFGYIL